MQEENQELEGPLCGGIVKPASPPPDANPNGYYSCIDEEWIWIENIG